MATRRSPAHVVARLLGEFMREAAVLVAVFVPLDWTLQNKTLTHVPAAVTLGLVVGLLSIGILLEVKSR